MCVKCGVDSMLPGFWGMCDRRFLKQMREHWFNTGYEYVIKDGRVIETREVELGLFKDD